MCINLVLIKRVQLKSGKFKPTIYNIIPYAQITLSVVEYI